MGAPGAMPDAALLWHPPYVVDLLGVLGPFARGGHDPAMFVDAGGAVWRTTRTPEGAATLRLRPAAHEIEAEAWGPGASWAVASVPSLLGGDDDATGFPVDRLPAHLATVWRRRMVHVRTPRSARVLEALVAAILEQKVTGVQARRAWRGLLRDVGELAPGPTPREMHVFPSVAQLRDVPSWAWHRWGAGPQQSAAIMRAVAVAGRLEECAGLAPDEARRRLLAVDGIGPWTAAEVGQRALGDADAVSFGDYHLAQGVVFAFTARRGLGGEVIGDRDGTDARMAELLEPFAGHRYRVQRLVELSGIVRPPRGPRMTIADHRRR